MGYSPTEYAEFTEPPAEVASHGFLLRRVWHLAIPTPPAMGYSILPRNTPNSQNLLLRCPPTDFTDLHRYLGCTVLPQNSQNLAAWVWQGCHTLLHLCASVPSVGGSSLPEVSVRSVRSVGISFLPRISQIYTDTYGALFSHRIHRIHRIWQRGYGRDAIPSYICAHLCHLWEALLCQKFLCVPCVLWESLSSHGFLLRRVWHFAIPTPPAMGYSPTEYAEFTEPPTEMSSHGFHRLTQIVRCAVLPQNSQNTQNLAAWVWQGCHTLLHLCSSVSSVGGSSLQEVLCIRCIPWELLHRLFGWCS